VLRFRLLRRAAAIGISIAMLVTMSVPMVAAAESIDVQILGLNDFHGQLEVVDPVVSSGGRIGPLSSGQCNPPGCMRAGGAAYLATHVNQLKATNPRNTVFVSAGDLIGATPLLSAAFHDEPSIEAFNQMGLHYNGVGNHEFDEGITELLRMQFGNRKGFGYVPSPKNGCHPVDGCGDGDNFTGAKFKFLAANVAYKEGTPNAGKTIFPPYAIHTTKDGAKMAFIGMTLEGTPLIVSPDGIANVDFLDEAASVNALVPVLKSQGIEAIVVLLHEGGSPSNTGGNPALINTCDNPSGALPPIVTAMDAEVDIVITGHTNWAVNCLIGGKVVTGAASQGRIVTEIDAQVDPATGDFVPNSITVDNEIVTQNVKPNAKMLNLIAEYNEVIAPIANRIVGATTAGMTRTANAAGESQLGRLIADAQLASSQGVGAQLAFMNPGGIRADLNFTGDITHGQAFAVQPFSNIVTTKTFTGAQIEQVLEQQFRTSAGAARTLVLAVSAGFTYTWNATGPLGDKVDPASIMLDDPTTPAVDFETIDPAGEYRVTMNSFLASGGDDFPAFTLGTDEDTGEDDLVALEAYLAANNPYTPSLTPARIVRLN
jgi:5'-nucleotidase